jgi:hypothetical protein
VELKNRIHIVINGQQVIVSNNKDYYQQQFKTLRFAIQKATFIMQPKVALSTAASTASTNVVKLTKTYTMIIKHIAVICGFPIDSTMMGVIAQQGWAMLSDVTLLTLSEIRYLTLLKDDGT